VAAEEVSRDDSGRGGSREGQLQPPTHLGRRESFVCSGGTRTNRLAHTKRLASGVLRPGEVCESRREPRPVLHPRHTLRRRIHTRASPCEANPLEISDFRSSGLASGMLGNAAT
jgi:hypothetical protein